MPLLKQILLVMTYQKGMQRSRPPEIILSNNTKLPESSILSYTLTKMDYEKFGVTILGGIGTFCTGIYIKGISPFGVCGCDGRLRMSDHIFELRGKCLLNVTHEGAFNAFRKYKRNVYIVVSRIMDDTTDAYDEDGRLTPNQEATLTYNAWDCSDEPDILETKCI